MKSDGKRSELRLTALLRFPVVTPYNTAKSESSSTLWPRIQRIDCAMRSIGMISLLIDSREQPRHLNDGCVENVEQELRCNADGKHEQCHRDNHELFASQKIGKSGTTFCEWSAKE